MNESASKRFELMTSFQPVLRRLATWLAGLSFVSLPIGISAQETPAKDRSAEVLARVAETPIRAGRVEAYLRETVPGWPVAAALQPPLRKAAFEHLINRELVFAWLEQNSFGTSLAEIEWRLDELKASLNRVGKSLEEYLQGSELELEELRKEIAWEIAWRKYLNQTLTEDYLAQRFAQSPRDFDGTELKVAQILLERAKEQSDQNILQVGEELRQRLLRGELTWDEAVRSHSIAASRDKAGELGWIRRHEPMPEAFSQVAFQLAEGEIAAPLASGFGVHLIKCLESRPGKRQFGDAREAVRRAEMAAEFHRLAEAMRTKVKLSIAEGK